MSVMGMPVEGRCCDAQTVRPQLPQGLNEAHMKSLTGNAMHVAVVGTLLMVAISEARVL